MSSPPGPLCGLVLIAFLLVADTFTVLAPALARPERLAGAPLAAFGIALVGLVGLERRALAHRHDDERRVEQPGHRLTTTAAGVPNSESLANSGRPKPR